MKWRIIELHTESPEMNMAIDDAILTNVSSGKSDSTIRLYKWSPEAVSLGFAQDQSVIKDKNIKVVRRPTGGNAFYHHAEDLAYSVVAPKRIFNNDLWKTYRAISGCIAGAFNFVSFSKAEINNDNQVIVDGKKICGSAINFADKKAFLQQGSIFCHPKNHSKILNVKPSEIDLAFVSELTDSQLYYSALHQAFKLFAGNYYFDSISNRELKLAETLAKERYSNPDWSSSVKF